MKHKKTVSNEEIINSPEVELSENTNMEDEQQTIIKKLQEENAQLINEKKRVLADWDNARKQYSNEQKNIIKYRAYNVIHEILPIIDNFERALQVTNVTSEVKNFLKGFEMTFNQLKTILTNEGVKEIEVKIGDEFNANYHFALEAVISDKYLPNQIVKVIQKGYQLYDKILRVATVQIAKDNNITNNDEEKSEEKEGN